MIIYLALQVFLFIGIVLGHIFGTVTELPFGADAALVQYVSYWYGFLDEVWILLPVWVAFLWYLGARVALYGLKLFLGHRTPAHVD